MSERIKVKLAGAGATREEMERVEDICQHTPVPLFRVWEVMKFGPHQALKKFFTSLRTRTTRRPLSGCAKKGRQLVDEARWKAGSEEALGSWLTARYLRLYGKKWF